MLKFDEEDRSPSLPGVHARDQHPVEHAIAKKRGLASLPSISRFSDAFQTRGASTHTDTGHHLTQLGVRSSRRVNVTLSSPGAKKSRMRATSAYPRAV